MKKSVFVGLVVLFGGVFAYSFSTYFLRASLGGGDPTVPIADRRGKTMRAFRSEQDLKDYFRAAIEKQKRDAERRRSGLFGESAANSNASPSPATKSAAQAGKDADDSITNNQHAGVDEGGIVKLHGDHLVILRRGRLFTVKIGDNSLR